MFISLTYERGIIFPQRYVEVYHHYVQYCHMNISAPHNIICSLELCHYLQDDVYLVLLIHETLFAKGGNYKHVFDTLHPDLKTDIYNYLSFNPDTNKYVVSHDLYLYIITNSITNTNLCFRSTLLTNDTITINLNNIAPTTIVFYNTQHTSSYYNKNYNHRCRIYSYYPFIQPLLNNYISETMEYSLCYCDVMTIKFNKNNVNICTSVDTHDSANVINYSIECISLFNERGNRSGNV